MEEQESQNNNTYFILTKSKIKFYLSRKVIYYLSIFSFIFIFGFFMFFISHSKNSELNIINKSFSLEKDP